MKKTLGALIIVALLVTIAVVVFAKGIIGKSPENSASQTCPVSSEAKTTTMPYAMGAQNNGGMQISNMTAFADTLNLSNEQKSKINGIMTANKTDAIKKNAERDILEADLTKFINEENPNLEAIEKQVQKIANLEANIRYSQIKTNLEMKLVLTKEQRDSLKNIHKTGNIPMMGHATGATESKVPDCCDTK